MFDADTGRETLTECDPILDDDPDNEDYGKCADCGEHMEGDGNLYRRKDGQLVCQYCL